jgi:hypothetical protein
MRKGSYQLEGFFFGLHFRARWGTEPYVALHEINICFPVMTLVFLSSLPLQS